MMILDGWCQEANNGIYILNSNSILCYVRWSDIIDGEYYTKTLIDTDVESFFVAKNGVGIIYKNRKVAVPRMQMIDMNQLSKNAIWRIIVSVGGHWIVSGDLDGQAIIASISTRTRVMNSLTISRSSSESSYARIAMHSIKPLFIRRRRSVILACEHDGSLHVISVGYRSDIAVIKSIRSVVPQNVHNMLYTAMATDREGHVILTGSSWCKKVIFKIC